MTHYLLRGADLATLNEAGNRWGGWMASQSGAMPALPDAVRNAIAAAIERGAENHRSGPLPGPRSADRGFLQRYNSGKVSSS